MFEKFVTVCLIILAFLIGAVFGADEAKNSILKPTEIQEPKPLEEDTEVAVIQSGIVASYCVAGMVVVTWDNSLIQLMDENNKPMTCSQED